MRRNDIRKFVNDEINKKNISLQTTIFDLPDELMEKLAEKLTCKGGVVHDWRILASHYNYDHTTIQQIGSRKSGSAQYSPTIVLFQKLRAERATMKLEELVKVLGDRMSRFDVVRKLESFFK